MTDQAESTRDDIIAGRTALGIELGSTRVKAVLIGPDHQPIAAGDHAWENQYVEGMWTYSLDAVVSSLRGCFAALAAEVLAQHGVPLTRLGGIGVSAMMHGYLALDSKSELLTPFRTWRNTNTGAAAEQLSQLFGVNIPHRWSVAHLYQALLEHEPHVHEIASVTTLAGYLHRRLSDETVLGIGDASGMFPIDSRTGDYDTVMVDAFDEVATQQGLRTPLTELLPRIRRAGDPAGNLTAEGALLLDPSGKLVPGAPMCPPEGDAGTGMVATNSVAPRTANVSAGTSIFAMVVLDRTLTSVHQELDLVTTPAGDPVAMVHCNNGASELGTWVALFTELSTALELNVDRSLVFETLIRCSLDGDPDCGGLISYNYLSGEPIVQLIEGRPLILRTPGSTLSLANFMRSQLFGSLATLRIGMDVLQKREHVQIDRMFAHGGLFRTAGVAQRFLAAAIDTPVSVGAIAAEGGAWGIALLAAFAAPGISRGRDLATFLAEDVFASSTVVTLDPDPVDVAGFGSYMSRFIAALPVEQAATRYA